MESIDPKKLVYYCDDCGCFIGQNYKDVKTDWLGVKDLCQKCANEDYNDYYENYESI